MKMTSKKAVEIIETFTANIILTEELEAIKKDLKVLETLKYRVHLKEDTIKGAYFTINEKGVPEIENDTKDYDIAWIKASGFVFKNSEEYKLLKRWLEDDK